MADVINQARYFRRLAMEIAFQDDLARRNSTVLVHAHIELYFR